MLQDGALRSYLEVIWEGQYNTTVLALTAQFSTHVLVHKYVSNKQYPNIPDLPYIHCNK